MTQRTQQVSTSAKRARPSTALRSDGASGQRILRIGVVEGAKVIEERIIKNRQTIAVGTTDNNVFVVRSKDLPASYDLFELVDDEYHLNFTDAMTGRVTVGNNTTELSQLKARARKVAGGYQLPLPDDARGKVVLGGITFLFQFVQPPPVAPRPQLPVSVIRGAGAVDWPTTIIAAFSFLAHFLALGAVYSDWLDPVVDYEVNVQNVIETVRNLPAPPPIEEKAVEQDKPEARPAETKKEVKPEPKVQQAKVDRQPAPGEPKRKLSSQEVAALSNELDSFDMGILGVNTGKSATADVLSAADNVSTSAMDRAAASSLGVSGGGPGGLKLGGAGGAIKPGEAVGLNQLGTTGKSSGSEGSGKVAEVKGPTGNASVGGASVAGGSVGNASSVVAGLRAGFRACYNRGLATDPDASGKIDLKLRIGPGGEVTGVAAAVTGNIPAGVLNCVKGRAKAARFSPPEGGSAVVSVPVSFVKQ